MESRLAPNAFRILKEQFIFCLTSDPFKRVGVFQPLSQKNEVH